MENVVSIPVRGICKLWVNYGSSSTGLGDGGLVRITGICNEIVSLGTPSVIVLKVLHCSDVDLRAEFAESTEPLIIASSDIKTIQVVSSPAQVQEEHPEFRPIADASLNVPISLSPPA